MSFDRDELSRLRDAYADREGDSTDVPADRIWAAAAGELSPEDTQALALQAAADPDLASLWTLALDKGAAERDDDDAVIAQAPAAGGELVQLRWPGIGVALALAAALLLFLRPPADEVWRGADSVAITVTAMDLSADGLHLNWDAPPDGIWSLRIFDADLTPVYRADRIADSMAIVPLDALPDGLLTWQVRGVWPDGNEQLSPLFPLDSR